MRIGVLGPLEVADGNGGGDGVGDGDAVQIAGGRLRALLIRLALDPGRFVGSGALADALWEPDQIPADPGNALQSLVSRLRRALGSSHTIEYGPAGYRLAVEPADVDAVRFEQLTAEGRRALAAGDAEDAHTLLTNALSLWRGPALADVADSAFAAAPAHRLEELRFDATADRYEAALAAGRTEAVVPGLRELAESQPLRERPRILLVKALYAAGRQAEALAAYEDFRGRLAEELGTDPSPELQAVHLAVLRGDDGALRDEGALPIREASKAARDAPAASAPGPARSNLRSPLNSFVGRDEELRQVRTLLKDARLVTLTGPGGAGKTRLASTAAAQLAADDRPAGGVWLAELAPVTDADDVAFAVLSALGQREAAVLDARYQAAPRDVFTRLTDALSAAPTTLVLDNCEHVIAAAADLADRLLGCCPQLRILATSREPLGIAGETLCPVPPLGLPADTVYEADLTYPAIRLFADRARAARPDFAVTAANAPTVIEICRRLDGLPLAIELAAARLRTLPVQEVAARLDDRFRLLTTGSRTALPRHRTLQAVVAWSWELMDEDERRLAERLSVFPGGVSPEAVAGVTGRDTVSALDALAALADKSLLQQAHEPQHGAPRYRMLETLREFGHERLAASDGLAAARAAHAAYFLELAETAEPLVRGHDQLHWIAVLDAEHDNLLAALRYAIDAGDAATAVRISAALGMFWSVLGHHSEAADWTQLALAVPGDSPTEARAAAIAFCIINSASSGQVGLLGPYVEELKELAAQVDTAHGQPILAALEPGVAMFANDDDTGIRLIEERLDHPDPWARAMLRLMRAAFKENQGYAAGIDDDLRASAAGFRAVGDRWGTGMALHQLAEYQALIGEDDAARAGYEEALGLMRELRAQDDVSQLRVRIAELDAQQGRTDEARALLTEVLDACLRDGRQHIAAVARHALGELARLTGDLDAAERWYEEGLTAWRQGAGAAPDAMPQLEALLRSGFAHLRCAQGDLVAAREHLVGALRAAEKSQDMPVTAIVGVAIADLAAHEGKVAYAAELLGAADGVRGVRAAQPCPQQLAARLRRELGEDFEPARARGAELRQGDAVTMLRGYV
ncbi:BTAD domain-containing putative transcriptional regulator [Streptomyces boninensis]|uniref:BTAD domain-containing putative transcriptional regulator n=1 Tax=Streptomyces boninensis TaxID=2039455 RepID=UPI003B21251C